MVRCATWPHHRPAAGGAEGRKSIAHSSCARACRSARGSPCAATDVGVLDRLLTIALPRIRDFRGLSPKQFDARATTRSVLNEQSMFTRSPGLDRTGARRGHGSFRRSHQPPTTRRPGTAGRSCFPVQGKLNSAKSVSSAAAKRSQGPGYNRCQRCGVRTRCSQVGLCRICLREIAPPRRTTRCEPVQW